MEGGAGGDEDRRCEGMVQNAALGNSQVTVGCVGPCPLLGFSSKMPYMSPVLTLQPAVARALLYDHDHTEVRCQVGMICGAADISVRKPDGRTI